MTTGGPMQGATIGSYVIRQEIGNGGMGTVYLAEHVMLGRRAAIKVLLPEMSANQEMVKRFFNEARAASAIKSPGIVEIYDFGYHSDGSAYIVMELLEGESLSQRLLRFRVMSTPQAMPVGQALTVARQIASALAPAHRAGIVHRDLKPDNIYLVPDSEASGGERAKILDFGIAKLSGDALGGNTNLTSTKVVMGSPHYMSPEQCRGGSAVVDSRSDLYALGCILYECLAGRQPFVGDGFGELMGAHLHVTPTPLPMLAPHVPTEVDALVQRLLAKTPQQRLQTADEAAAAINDLLGRVRPAGGGQMSPSAATMHMSPNTPMHMAPGTPMHVPRAPTGSAMGPIPTPGSMPARALTPLPMQLQSSTTNPTMMASGHHQRHGGMSPSGAAPAYGSMPQQVPTTMRHSSGAVSSPPPSRASRRSLAVLAGTVVASAAAVVIVIKVMGEAPAPESALPGDEVTLLDPVAPPTGTQAVAPPVTPPVAATEPVATADAGAVAAIAVDAAVAPPADAAAAVAIAEGSAASPPPEAGSGSGSAKIALTPAEQAAKDARDAERRARRKKPVVVEVPVAPPPLPETLSAAAQSAGFDPFRGKIRACALNKGVKGPLSVYVAIDVLPSGKVSQARITNGSNAILGACVSSTLIHATFAPTQKGGTVRRVYVQD